MPIKMNKKDCIVRNKPDTNQLYYLSDSRSVVGNCMMFWRKNGKGYTYNLDDCETYTKETAFAKHEMRETDIPYPKDVIDSLAERHIDFQGLKNDFKKSKKI